MPVEVRRYVKLFGMASPKQSPHGLHAASTPPSSKDSPDGRREEAAQHCRPRGGTTDENKQPDRGRGRAARSAWSDGLSAGTTEQQGSTQCVASHDSADASS